MAWPSCQFCGAFITDKPATDYPSNSCQMCWLTINAALTQREPDFTTENKARINYVPESWVIL